MKAQSYIKWGMVKNILLWEHNWGEGILHFDLPDLYTHTVDPYITLQEAAGINQISTLFRPVLNHQAQEELNKLQAKMNQISLSPHAQDNITWKWTESGNFTVRSAYKALTNGPRIQSSVHKIWNLQTAPRIKVFGWLVLLNRLLTIDNLNKRGWPLVNRCILCRAAQETIQHLLRECPFSIELYMALTREIPEKLPPVSTEIQALPSISCPRATITHRSTILIIQFILWREEMCKNI